MIDLDEGMPVASVDIRELATCDPAQGILPLLRQPSPSFYFTGLLVFGNGHPIFGAFLGKRGRSWELQSQWYGEVFVNSIWQKKEWYKARRCATDFLLVMMPEIKHECLAFKTPEGPKLVCLHKRPWQSDALFATDDPAVIVALLKEDAARCLAKVSLEEEHDRPKGG